MVCLPDGEKIIHVCLAVSTEYRRVTDGQTDERTERQTERQTFDSTVRAMNAFSQQCCVTKSNQSINQSITTNLRSAMAIAQGVLPCDAVHSADMPSQDVCPSVYLCVCHTPVFYRNG